MKRIMILDGLVLVTACVFSVNVVGAQELPQQTEGFIQITSSNSYHITNSITVTNTSVPLTKLVIILPLAQTNGYQQVGNVIATEGEILSIPETDDRYIRYTVTGSGLPLQGQTRTYGYEFDVTLHGITVNLEQITTIYPYNATSDIYRWYTGTSGVYVDPSNPTIQAIGSEIWDQSSDLLDYAKQCYEYVAQNYQYLNPGTGLHPLSELIANGGGDCGNLSSIYISLLRYKNIPSRHIVTVRPDGLYHAWADFYMENYGWVPVDVTYKLGNLNGDYFGKYDGNGIVFTKEAWLLLERDGDYSYYCSVLQTYNWWYWATSDGDISTSHSLSSTITSVEACDELPKHFALSQNYPNPFNATTTIEFSLQIPHFVKVNVFNVRGQKVSTILDEYKEPGSYVLIFDAGGLSSGTYFYQLRSGSFTDTKQMMAVK